ncbi:MAG: chromosomal replication initiator protein DnaA, partial [Candidatus Babeliales bacterium]
VIPFNAIHSNHATLKKSSLYKQNGYINQSYLFDTFIVGPNNSLACAAAHAITEKPGFLYNPMFIYGGSGLGKTHLLHAIGNAIKKNHKNMSILYQTADRFVNEFINAIRFDKIHKFQTKYKTIDVLLIDDIQFISNKEQTQEAFFHIFNSLYDAHKQIVFSSDTFPQNIGGIAERLRSRLAAGLVADIHVPTLETKIAILRKKADLSNEVLSNEVAHFIASHVISNVRELEGALIRVIAFAHLSQQPISLELAKKVLMHTKKSENRIISLEKIAKEIEKYYPYTLAQLCSKERSKNLVLARQIMMFFMKKLTNKSLRTIGDFFGGKDHSTVKHAITKIEHRVKEELDFQKKLNQIEQEIIS